MTRIHHESFDATRFNPTLADRHWGSGRFDATDDEGYGFLYAAESDPCAVAEVLLRDLPLDSTGALLLARRALTGRRISWVAPRTDLELVSLRSGSDLAAVGQDSWLTKCDSKDYGFTRRWGHEIRRWAPWCQGFVWRSRREEDNLAFIFFDDRQANVFEEVEDSILSSPHGNRIDTGLGFQYVRLILAEYNVTVYR